MRRACCASVLFMSIVARRGDRGGDALLRDLVDQDALDVRVDVLDLLGDVPRDRLTFAIGIGREVDGLVLARRLADLRDDLLLALDDLVDRLEVRSRGRRRSSTSADRARDRPTPSRRSRSRGTCRSSAPSRATRRRRARSPASPSWACGRLRLRSSASTSAAPLRPFAAFAPLPRLRFGLALGFLAFAAFGLPAFAGFVGFVGSAFAGSAFAAFVAFAGLRLGARLRRWPWPVPWQPCGFALLRLRRLFSSLLTASSLERASRAGAARAARRAPARPVCAHDRVDAARTRRDRVAHARCASDRARRRCDGAGAPRAAQLGIRVALDERRARREQPIAAAAARPRRDERPSLRRRARRRQRARLARRPRRRSTASASAAISGLRCENVPRAACMPIGKHADERATARDDLLEQRRVARGIRDVDAAAEHDGRGARRRRARRDARRHRCRARRPRRRARRALGEVLARARGRGPSPVRVAARAPTIATAGPSPSSTANVQRWAPSRALRGAAGSPFPASQDGRWSQGECN